MNTKHIGQACQVRQFSTVIKDEQSLKENTSIEPGKNVQPPMKGEQLPLDRVKT